MVVVGKEESSPTIQSSRASGYSRPFVRPWLLLCLLALPAAVLLLSIGPALKGYLLAAEAGFVCRASQLNLLCDCFAAGDPPVPNQETRVPVWDQ